MSAPDDRFWSHVNKTESCWLWVASLNASGYGQFSDGSRVDGTKTTLRAHVVAYEMTVGKVPLGLELDHLCRVRQCVNPDHLEAVTKKENILRGDSPPAKNARKMACAAGHPLAGDNLVVRSDGRRRCRTCKNEGQNRRRRLARGGA